MGAYKTFTLLLIFSCMNSVAMFGQGETAQSSQDSTKLKTEYPYVLPIWGQKVADRNIKMQLPFGINVNYVYNQMTLDLTHFSMNFYDGENLDDIINPETLNFTETVGTTNGVNIRADAWIFPFFNVYGIYSRNQGSTKVAFQPRVVEKDLGPNGNLMEIRTLEEPIDVDKVTFTANSFGIGSTLVYGWSDYFVNVDGNMTWSTSDLLEQTVAFFVGSARIGKRVSLKNDMKLAFYIGAMYRDFVNKENNTGSIGVPELDEGIARAIDGLTAINDEQILLWESLPESTPGRDEKLDELYAREERLDHASERLENSDAINYDIKKEIVNNWSTQIGFNLEINENWMYRAELGYRDDQKFFMTGLQYRFGF
ncbi:hypothetical protein [Carboxylicivirga sp. RSCT41]|uniref:hypothetical protein n=1 Tax=Carboxylicivirga agarovorans TaxID=3417570 RepID=UPI003D346B69